MTQPWSIQSPLAAQHPFATRDPRGGIGVVVQAMPPRFALRLAASRGQQAALAAKVRALLGFDLPATGRRTAGPEVAILWAGPEQWLAMAAASAPLQPLRTDLVGLAGTTEQGDGLVIVRLSGPKVRRTLMKLVGIDVHPAAFAVDAVALAPIAHVPVQMWRLPDDGAEAVFEIALPQSYAASLWETLVDAAAELGLDARPMPQPAAPK